MTFACAIDPILVLSGPVGIGILVAHWAVLAALAGSTCYQIVRRIRRGPNTTEQEQ
jgi:hypothetical protein